MDESVRRTDPVGFLNLMSTRGGTDRDHSCKRNRIKNLISEVEQVKDRDSLFPFVIVIKFRVIGRCS